MTKKEIIYDFHDAIIVNFHIEKESEFSMTIQLYEVFYPTKDLITLTFSGIYNWDKTLKLLNEIKKDHIEPEWNGTRIESFDYDRKKISKDSDLFLFMKFDGYKSLTIHCKTLNIEKINYSV